jgi:hypothetical protein
MKRELNQDEQFACKAFTSSPRKRSGARSIILAGAFIHMTRLERILGRKWWRRNEISE